jgi:small membrane protein
MSKIQVLFIAALIFILINYFRRFRSMATDKILISLMLLSGIFFVLYPDLTTIIARYLGIGRGTDLIFYLAILGFGYMILVLYSKIKNLEDQITSLVRKQALENISNGKNT